MGVPVSSRSRAYKKISGGPSTGAAHGTQGGVKPGGRVFRGAGRGRGSQSVETASIPPAWVAGGIPDQGPDAQGDQPLSLSVGQYMEKNPFPTVFSLTTPPTGFFITDNGKITVFGASAAAHSVTVQATNAFGSSSDTFTWTIV